MSLSIGQALGRGTRRTLSVSGVVLFVAILVYQIVLVGTVNTVIVNSLPPNVSTADVGSVGFSFPIPTGVAAVVGIGSILFGTAAFLVATRLLSRDLSALGSIPPSLLGYRFVRAFLSTIVVSLVLAVVIPIGLVFLLVPGLFLAVSFQFAIFAVGVEDCGPVAALRRSWELATGNRWRLFGLLALITVVAVVASIPGTAVSLVDPTAGQLVSLFVNSVVAIVMYGIIADAFVQLREGPTVEPVSGGAAI